MTKRIPQEDKQILYDLVNENIQDHIDYVSSYLGQTPEYVLSNYKDINFSEIQNLPSLSGRQELSDLLECSVASIKNITKELESDLKNYRTFVLKSEARTGKKHSKETLRKMSEAQSGENNAMYGKTHSEETLRKLSEANSGENHPRYGKTPSEETRRKISEALNGENHPMYGKTGKNHHSYGKTPSEETLRKMSEAQSGENNPNYGKTHSEETLRKMAQAHLKRIRELGNVVMPNFNPFACQLIDAYGIEYGYNFITGLSPATEIQVTDKVRRNVPVENGQGIGECHIKITDENGNVIEERWVDGYDPEKNVVIEFYEQAHNRKEEKDKIRQNTIQDFLGCEFIILREGSGEVKNLEDRLMVI